MQKKYLSITTQGVETVIISPEVGEFEQHYINKMGWLTCLGDSCPFCDAATHVKYNKKLKYYYEVVDLFDNQQKILPLSKKRSDILFNVLGKNVVGKPFLIAKRDTKVWFTPTNTAIKIPDSVYDWDQVFKPITKDRAKDIVAKDLFNYT